MRARGLISRPLRLSSPPAICCHEQRRPEGVRAAPDSLRHPQVYIGRRGLHSQSVLEASLQTTHDLITGLHAVTHTPWFVTIPLVALGVNILFRLPWTIHAQRIAQQRVKLTPLMQAWMMKHVRDVQRKQPPGTAAKAEVTKRFLRTSKQLYKDWGLQQWKMYGSLLSFPFWLAAIETIRRMCGGPPGILGQLFGRKGADGAEAAAVLAAEPSSPAAASVAVDASAQPGDLADSLVGLYDPSLTTGGCLWFPDLTLADPYHILPFTLSAVLVANLIPKSDAGRRALFGLEDTSSKASPMVPQSRAMRGFHRGLLILSGSVCVITAHFPSAIHLYWIASSGVSYLMAKGVHRFMPIPKPTTEPCKGREFPIIIPSPPSHKEQGVSVRGKEL